VFSESCERRTSTTTPLQALALMNGDLLNDEAAYLAKRLMQKAGESRSAQIELAFETALNRAPAAAERAKFLESGMTLESICRVLLNSNEFIYVE
jgi:hypothetical protein